jgi:hypothetical protein
LGNFFNNPTICPSLASKFNLTCDSISPYTSLSYVPDFYTPVVNFTGQLISPEWTDSMNLSIVTRNPYWYGSIVSCSSWSTLNGCGDVRNSVAGVSCTGMYQLVCACFQPEIRVAPKMQSFAIGSLSACLLTLNNEIYCGGSYLPSVTNPLKTEDIPIPLTKKIVGSDTLYAAQLLDNSIITWGFLDGENTGLFQPVMINIPGYTLTDVTMISTTVCVSTNSSNVYCMGQNPLGYTIPGQTANVRVNSYIQINSVANVSGLHSSYDTFCGNRFDGKIQCWGFDTYGQRGDNRSVSLVNYVYGINTSIQVDMGGYHACTLLQNKQVWCWGSNKYGELGRIGSNSSIPIRLFSTIL